MLAARSDRGSGRPIVLLSAGGEPGLETTLAASCRVVCFDATPDIAAAAVLQTLDRLALRRFDLIGRGPGATIAWSLIATSAWRIRRAVLWELASLPDDAGREIETRVAVAPSDSPLLSARPDFTPLTGDISAAIRDFLA